MKTRGNAPAVKKENDIAQISEKYFVH